MNKERIMSMNNNQYNEHSHNRKRGRYRFTLGLQQMISRPWINIIWLIYAIGIDVLFRAIKMLENIVEVPSILEKPFHLSLMSLLILISILSVVVLCQMVGYLTAISDEANMKLVFEKKYQPPILTRKKTDKATGITERDFYTTIPRAVWNENKEAICDVLNIHLIGKINYGGRNYNKGNHIAFTSAKGRIVKDRGDIYDDEF